MVRAPMVRAPTRPITLTLACEGSVAERSTGASQNPAAQAGTSRRKPAQAGTSRHQPAQAGTSRRKGVPYRRPGGPPFPARPRSTLDGKAGCSAHATQIRRIQPPDALDERVSGEMPMPKWHVGARHEAPVGALNG